jgi:hypothetical protein
VAPRSVDIRSKTLLETAMSVLRLSLLLSATLAASLLAGCDLLGESAESVAARKEAEGKAVGSACRHAMRAIEDCYSMNPKAPKAAVFAGWREMDEYMRENKLDGVAPSLAKAPTKGGDAEEGDAAGEAASGAKAKSKAKESKAHGT